MHGKIDKEKIQAQIVEVLARLALMHKKIEMGIYDETPELLSQDIMDYLGEDIKLKDLFSELVRP